MKFINNIGNNTVKNILLEESKKYKNIVIVSPFLTPTDVLFNILQTYENVKLITRLSPPASPKLFLDLLEYKNLTTYVYDDDSLHSKIYYLHSNDSSTAIVGSSNMTNGGLLNNKEYNVLIYNDQAEIASYIQYLIKNSYEILNAKTIEYYESFYKKPTIENRYNKIKLNKHIINEYNDNLSKYLTIKGILEVYNSTDLPFTYLFDAFDHQYKTKIIKDYALKDKIKNKDDLVKYFKIFLSDYFSEENKKLRYDKFNKNMNFVKNFNTVSDEEIVEFILSLHSVGFGSGSGVRKSELANVNITKVKQILNFILNENLEMSQKISIILTKRKKGGMKIDYLGPSAVQEIPGWLMPNDYPIINKKMEFVLNCFKV